VLLVLKYIVLLIKNPGFDYNAEIPFEKLPSIGFYDTTNEQFDPEKIDFKHLHIDNGNLSAKEENE
jgi:pre-mRNA-splicing factor CDC5/CEF1